MTERRLSPTAATAQAKKAMRNRLKIQRLDKQPVDSPHVFAGRIAALLKAASHDNPGEWSEAYTEHVINRFSDRYIELCRVAPIPQKAGAR